MRAQSLIWATLIVLALAAPAAFCQEKRDVASTKVDAPAAPAPAVRESELAIPEPGQQVPAAASAQQAPAPTVSTWDFVRMLLVLACVVGFIYLIFFLLRKGSGRKIQENDLIRILGSRSLSGSRALHLVEAGGSVYLIGSSDGGVELISQITDKESLDALKLKAAEQGPALRRSFQEILADIFKPAKKPFSLGESLQMLKSQRERLRKM